MIRVVRCISQKKQCKQNTPKCMYTILHVNNNNT